MAARMAEVHFIMEDGHVWGLDTEALYLVEAAGMLCVHCTGMLSAFSV